MPRVSSLIVIASLLVLLVGSFRGDQNLVNYFKLKQTQTKLKEVVDQLELETEQIENEIIRIKASPAYARKVLREKYHVTESNERIIFFAD